MKISQARLREAVDLKDLTLSMVAAHGMDKIITAAGGHSRHRVQSAEVAGLTIMYGSPPPAIEQRLDIWQGRKVFSITWDRTGLTQVIAFRPGEWQDVLRTYAGTQ
jgi:hypothetical protein